MNGGEHEPAVSCSRCDAVCCRLTVVVMPEDRVPRHLVETTPQGLQVMARGEDGWCVAIDPLRLCCSIYEQRPGICRKFAMGSAYCRSEREAYRTRFDAPPADEALADAAYNPKAGRKAIRLALR